jgi:hypothetical protein
VGVLFRGDDERVVARGCDRLLVEGRAVLFRGDDERVVARGCDRLLVEGREVAFGGDDERVVGRGCERLLVEGRAVLFDDEGERVVVRGGGLEEDLVEGLTVVVLVLCGVKLVGGRNTGLSLELDDPAERPTLRSSVEPLPRAPSLVVRVEVVGLLALAGRLLVVAGRLVAVLGRLLLLVPAFGWDDPELLVAGRCPELVAGRTALVGCPVDRGLLLVVVAGVGWLPVVGRELEGVLLVPLPGRVALEVDRPPSSWDRPGLVATG